MLYYIIGIYYVFICIMYIVYLHRHLCVTYREEPVVVQVARECVELAS